jgi:hypothetical protein
MSLACCEVLSKAKAAAKVWGCTVTSLRKRKAKMRPLAQKSHVTLPLASMSKLTMKLGTEKRSLNVKSPVTKEEGFSFFWSAYRDKLPSDLDDLLRLPEIWFSSWSPLLPLLVLLKYRPVRDQSGTRSLRLRA